MSSRKNTNNLIDKLTNLNRVAKRLIMIFFDAFFILMIVLASFTLRLDYLYWPKNQDIALVIFSAPLIAVIVFFSFGMYRSVIRYIGFNSLWSIAQAVTLYAVIWGLIGYEISRISFLPMDSAGIPRSVILINWMLTIIIIGGSRVLARWLFSSDYVLKTGNKSNVIIYGAGSTGRQLSQSMQLSSEYKHVAYIDDNLANERAYIDNIPVFSYDEIEKLIKKNSISEIFLALPSVSRKKRNRIIEKLSLFSVHVRSLPGIDELAGGKVRVDDLLEIDIEDLLGRTIVKPNEELLKIKISDKVIMISGAGGSIGSELCRQISFLSPKKLILFDISEASLYHIEQEIKSIKTSDFEIIPIIGSVCSEDQVIRILKQHKVQTIYHAAAYKHVPLVEFNRAEGVLNNSLGTMTFAKAAIKTNVETFVLISTDKAVRPTNIMGASKRIAELILQAFSKISQNTCFTMVRFGNVIDSSGSVIPLFRRQIKEGGPLTVTDKDIERFFMTIPEAVELVIQAGAMGQGGDVFVLDMGEPVKIYDLALKMIKLSGLKLFDDNNKEGDIEVKITGLRPGEKLYEELLVGNDATLTENKMIMRANERMIEWDVLEPKLDILIKAAKEDDNEKIISLIKKIVPEFKPKI